MVIFDISEVICKGGVSDLMMSREGFRFHARIDDKREIYVLYVLYYLDLGFKFFQNKITYTLQMLTLNHFLAFLVSSWSLHIKNSTHMHDQV